jgi:hypothetical protein
MRCSKKRALFDHLVGARRTFETGLRRACFDLSDGGALGFTLRSGARIQLDLILLPHDSREMNRSTNRFHRSGCRFILGRAATPRVGGAVRRATGLGGDNRCGTRKIEQRCGSVRKMQRLMNPNLIVPVSRPSRLSRIAWTGSVPIRRLRWLA